MIFLKLLCLAISCVKNVMHIPSFSPEVLIVRLSLQIRIGMVTSYFQLCERNGCDFRCVLC